MNHKFRPAFLFRDNKSARSNALLYLHFSFRFAGFFEELRQDLHPNLKLLSTVNLLYYIWIMAPSIPIKRLHCKTFMYAVGIRGCTHIRTIGHFFLLLPVTGR
jgi:hypothetical protein